MGEAGQDAPAEEAMKENDAFPAWAHTVEEYEKRIGVDTGRGLSSSYAVARLWDHGPNDLQEHHGPSMLHLVAQQFEDMLVRILLAAANISFALALSSSAGALTLSAFVEPLVIFLILVVNAEKGLEALSQIQSDHAAGPCPGSGMATPTRQRPRPPRAPPLGRCCRRPWR